MHPDPGTRPELFMQERVDISHSRCSPRPAPWLGWPRVPGDVRNKQRHQGVSCSPPSLAWRVHHVSSTHMLTGPRGNCARMRHLISIFLLQRAFRYRFPGDHDGDLGLDKNICARYCGICEETRIPRRKHTTERIGHPRQALSSLGQPRHEVAFFLLSRRLHHSRPFILERLSALKNHDVLLRCVWFPCSTTTIRRTSLFRCVMFACAPMPMTGWVCQWKPFWIPVDDSFRKAYEEDWVFQIIYPSDFSLPGGQGNIIPETPEVSLLVSSS